MAKNMVLTYLHLLDPEMTIDLMWETQNHKSTMTSGFYSGFSH